MVGVGDDQFSFPVVSNPVSHLMQSSPLWRISSRVYHHDKIEERAASENEEDTESFYSIIEGSASMEREFGENFELEKIDMLWEDFFCKEEKLEAEEDEAQDKTSSHNQLCLPRGGVVVLVAVVKLLKKVFLIRNNSARHHQLQVENNG